MKTTRTFLLLLFVSGSASLTAFPIPNNYEVKSETFKNRTTNSISAFIPTLIQRRHSLVQRVPPPSSPSSSSHLTLSSLPEGQNSVDSSDDEWKGFNPFERRATKDTSNPVIGGASQISYRRLRMNDIISELLQNVQSDETLNQVLSRNSDFLLEQLEDVDAVLEADSIYMLTMTREERYGRYREVMTERVEGATNAAVKKILESLKDFVLSHE